MKTKKKKIERIIKYLDEKKIVFTTNSIINNIITSRDADGTKVKHNNYAITVPLDFVREKDVSNLVVEVSIEILERKPKLLEEIQDKTTEQVEIQFPEEVKEQPTEVDNNG